MSNDVVEKRQGRDFLNLPTGGWAGHTSVAWALTLTHYEGHDGTRRARLDGSFGVRDCSHTAELDLCASDGEQYENALFKLNRLLENVCAARQALIDLYPRLQALKQKQEAQTAPLFTTE